MEAKRTRLPKLFFLMIVVLGSCSLLRAQIINGSFESGSGPDLSGWQWTCGAQSEKSAPAGGGDYSIRVFSGNTQGCWPGYSYQKLNSVTGGQACLLTAWAFAQTSQVVGLYSGTISNGVITLLKGDTTSSVSWKKLSVKTNFLLSEGDTAVVVLYGGLTGGPVQGYGFFDLVDMQTLTGVNIPDSNFFNALVAAGVDTNSDGIISFAECEAVRDLNVIGKNISDMTGIEAFINLQNLLCKDNNLTSLDISHNTALNYLHCNNNRLTSLDISKNTAISWLRCSENQLTTLDISGLSQLDNMECYNNRIAILDCSANPALVELLCYSNRLTSLNVTGCPVLKTLRCGDNLLDSLDVSGHTALEKLECNDNLLTRLNVAGCTALTTLSCQYNQLAALDVTDQPSLVTLDCYHNRLTSLDVSGCTQLLALSCMDNQLAGLDVSGNTKLENLICYNNVLTSVDVLINTALRELNCTQNQLSGLDVTHNTALQYLFCDKNRLTSLDVTKNVALYDLACGNNLLTTLNLSNNTHLLAPIGGTMNGFLDLSGMPTLYGVCVWVMPFPPAGLGNRVNTTGSPNIIFSTDCSNSIHDFSRDSGAINIFPNPSADFMTIEIKNNKNAVVEIYDINGTLLFMKSLPSGSEKIDVSGFAKGMYLMKVIQDRLVTVKKVLVGNYN